MPTEAEPLRAFDAMVAGAILLALFVCLAWLEPVGAPVSGVVRVVDGDTLGLAGERIRLVGMDAPELAQSCHLDGKPYACGEVARDALVRLTLGISVTCQARGRDRYGRLLAMCEAAGQDLGARLVRDGLAVPYGGYAEEGRVARLERLGLWAGSFEMPSEWRRGHPESHRAAPGRHVSTSLN